MGFFFSFLGLFFKSNHSSLFLGFGEDDNIMGILYFGYAEEYPEGKRNTEIEEKINWVK